MNQDISQGYERAEATLVATDASQVDTSVDAKNDVHRPKRNAPEVYRRGSIGSHLAYGLGTAALLAPMFIPDISMWSLAAGYLGIIVAAMIGLSVWAMIRAGRDALRKRHTNNKRHWRGG